jgi:L-fucose mutarotase
MHTLMSMGHGDELVLADANFPAASHAKLLLRSDCGISELLDAILIFFPLDTFVTDSVFLMNPVKGDRYRPTIWEEYKTILPAREPGFRTFSKIERFAFYERAKQAFAIVATAESQRYANVILKKGIVESDRRSP